MTLLEPIMYVLVRILDDTNNVRPSAYLNDTHNVRPSAYLDDTNNVRPSAYP